MISRYFGSKTQEFPVPDDEAPLRLLLFHACRLKFYYTPHYKPEKYHRYCQISLLFDSNYHHSSFPMYLFDIETKRTFSDFSATDILKQFITQSGFGSVKAVF